MEVMFSTSMIYLTMKSLFHLPTGNVVENSVYNETRFYASGIDLRSYLQCKFTAFSPPRWSWHNTFAKSENIAGKQFWNKR